MTDVDRAIEIDDMRKRLDRVERLLCTAIKGLEQASLDKLPCPPSVAAAPHILDEWIYVADAVNAVEESAAKYGHSDTVSGTVEPVAEIEPDDDTGVPSEYLEEDRRDTDGE